MTLAVTFAGKYTFYLRLNAALRNCLIKAGVTPVFICLICAEQWGFWGFFFFC